MEMRHRVGRELLLARGAAGLSQAEAGQRAGVSQTMVSFVERGVAHASVDVLEGLAAACGCEISIRVFPDGGPSLRDSRQLKAAGAILDATRP